MERINLPEDENLKQLIEIKSQLKNLNKEINNIKILIAAIANAIMTDEQKAGAKKYLSENG